MVLVEELKVVNWNCRGIISKLGRFKIMLYAEKPHVCCLNETFLRNTSKMPKFTNYRAVWKLET